ncbi:MAG: hypothetical protein ACKVW3_16790 [Phycisphaerales bacterium]
MQLRHDLARRERWRADDARAIAGLVSVNYTYAGKTWDDTVPQHDMEAFGTKSMALATIAERMRWGFPIDAEARLILIDCMVQELANPVWSARLAATSCLVQSGVTDADPALRARVEQMATDPDPDVASNARRQLEHRDELLAATRRMKGQP